MVIVGDNGDIIDLEGEGWTKSAENIQIEGEDGRFNTYTKDLEGTTVSVNIDTEITIENDDLF